MSVIITNEVLAQNFQHRKKFYIDNTQVQGSADHSNFPVLVSFTDPSFATISNSGYVTNSNGYDIVFTSSDGLTQLDHELTNYDPITGQVSAWVRFPSLSTTSDTFFLSILVIPPFRPIYPPIVHGRMNLVGYTI